MNRSVGAFAVCLVVGIALYPALIGRLARAGAGQRVSQYNPATHRIKAGTPTMGGVLFCVLAIAAWILFDRSRGGFLVAFAVVAGASLGILDDFANVRGRGSLGLIAWQKLGLQSLIGLLLGIGLDKSSLTRQLIPGFGTVDMHWGVVVLTIIAVVAASNAVNLTDGVDGLAASCSVFVLAATWALAWHVGNRPAAILSGALCGGVVAFLAYNWWPARVFMGDTGSLALGCALTILAAELRLLWLMPLLGIVFVVEILSVAINVTAIKRYHVRIFRASPLHHHFEELGLREQRLVVRFALAAAAGAFLCALAALKAGIGAA
jgi:phospho-N-acetylmuramoyl-pentapeptide-transferase